MNPFSKLPIFLANGHVLLLWMSWALRTPYLDKQFSHWPIVVRVEVGSVCSCFFFFSCLTPLVPSVTGNFYLVITSIVVPYFPCLTHLSLKSLISRYRFSARSQYP